MNIVDAVEALRRAGATKITVEGERVMAEFGPQETAPPPVYVPVPYPQPTVSPPTWQPPYVDPFVTWGTGTAEEPCLMRHFKPGEVAMVSCPCPRCTPSCLGAGIQ